jgi:hypothetical protein
MDREVMRRAFYNPPKGGNGRGVPTQNSMGVSPARVDNPLEPRPGLMTETVSPFQGPDAQQPSLVDDFAAGVQGARTCVEEAARVGHPDMRNYFKTKTSAQDDVGPVSAFDRERLNDVVPSRPQEAARVTPVYHPPSAVGLRGDGRKVDPLGMPEMGSNTALDGAQEDGTRDHPSHLLGRNPCGKKHK